MVRGGRFGWASVLLLRESGGGENLCQVGRTQEQDNANAADNQKITVP